MVFYTPTNDRQFRRYDFRTTTELLKTVFLIDCSVKSKLNSGAVRMGFCAWAGYKNNGKLSQLSINYLFCLIQQTIWELRNFDNRHRCWILFLDRMVAERTELLGLRLTKTLEVPNTITVGNPLSFPMVHITTPNGQRFMSYSWWKLD
jgi:hypothetical protein